MDKHQKQLQMLTVSNNQLVDDKRNIERQINKVRDQKAILETNI